MAKKVLIISTSLRLHSNSEILAKEVEKGALEAGHDVEFITLKDKTINFCKGCLSCQKLGHCVIDDDANIIVNKMLNSDVIVWATPIYYYEMSGQMKTLIDRANPLFELDYKFKDIYIITTSADSSKGVSNCILHGIKGWLDCLPKATIKGTLEAGGVNNPMEIRQFVDILVQAYELGKLI
ncbi:flavodoxin family protein [bacterium]|nr:flavodoxin family protein [bacterium]